MTRQGPEGPPVKGTCPAGHVTETTAAKNRNTARVKCATAGCEHLVTCRRVPLADRASSATATAPKGPARKRAAGATKKQQEPRPGPTVKRGRYRAGFDPDPKGGDPDGGDAGGSGADGGAPAGSGSGNAGVPPAPGGRAVDRPRRGRLATWWRGWRGARRNFRVGDGPDDDGDWTIPGIYR